jgi:MFS family permease
MTSAAVIAMFAAGGRRSRLRRAVTRCRSAGRLLRTPASRQSRKGLDWTNFFIADVQTGFGTFVAFYLADLGWSESSVGLALGAGGLAANASLLPLVSENLATSRAAAGSILISCLIIGPQIVVALLAPWVGYHSETYGRKPLLLIGMGLEAVRAGLFAFVTNYPLMVAIQLLDGISGSIINVLTVLVISDLTTGTGRFNLAQGVIGAMIGIAASLSTSITGFIFQEFGHWAGFIFIAGVAATGTTLAWLLLPETKPEKYPD